jgi:hypothetical protein
MISYFGKVKGSFLNYIFSWILMFIIIIILSISQIDAISVKL